MRHTKPSRLLVMKVFRRRKLFPIWRWREWSCAETGRRCMIRTSLKPAVECIAIAIADSDGTIVWSSGCWVIVVVVALAVSWSKYYENAEKKPKVCNKIQKQIPICSQKIWEKQHKCKKY